MCSNELISKFPYRLILIQKFVSETKTFSKRRKNNRKRVWNKEKTKADSQLDGSTHFQSVLSLLVKAGDLYIYIY